MKTGLGLYRKYRKLYAYFNLLRFSIRKHFVGFDVANQFLQRVDKISLQLILKKNGATIGKDCDIETGLVFHNCKNYTNLKIGNNCHIGKNCFFDLRDKILIENNVVISMQCTFITHIDLNKSELKEMYPMKHGQIFISDNTYLGVNSTILMNVICEEGCFVAACSLVNKNIGSRQIVGGVPAKLIIILNE